jgi:cyclic pyranopterin phosphate synthase
MPEDHYVWLPRQSILAFEEINQIVGAFASLGVTRVRITGGEPLLRHDLPDLVSLLSHDVRIEDIAVTTNGIMLARFAELLKSAGLTRVTVSLDTLKPDRFVDFTRSGRHQDVLEGIEFGRERRVEVRFIEYMDVGGATRWSSDEVVPRSEMLARISDHYGTLTPIRAGAAANRAPADRFELPDGTTFGIIASTTEPFCGFCDRSRITADGMWYRCLYAESGIDLKSPLREGASDTELAELIRRSWSERSDRGAADRLAVHNRGVLYGLDGLRTDPHREMHTRGG